MSGLKALSEEELLKRRAMRLKQIELFEGLSDQVLIELTSLMKEVDFKKNQLVITQGDLTRSLYIITEGRLKVFVSDEDGNQTIFTFLGKDDYFGELSLLDDAPRSASVITVSESKALHLDQQLFSEFLEKHPAVCWPLFRSLTAQIRKMDEDISILTSNDTYGRLVKTLNKEAVRQSDGTLITSRMTHQELADMIGSSREMVSRIFKDLRQAGFIEIIKKQVVIKKKIPGQWK